MTFWRFTNRIIIIIIIINLNTDFHSFYIILIANKIDGSGTLELDTDIFLPWTFPL